MLVQSEDSLDVTLFLDQSLLGHLTRYDPFLALHDGNLAEFWLVLEGVSHFLYLIWNAGYKKQITQFELELQAEVDKFAMTGNILCSQQRLFKSRNLHRQLFDVISFDQSLNTCEISRYQDANRYAAKFCRHLEVDCNFDKWQGDMLTELRRFYRYTQRDKIRHIDASVKPLS